MKQAYFFVFIFFCNIQIALAQQCGPPNCPPPCFQPQLVCDSLGLNCYWVCVPDPIPCECVWDPCLCGDGGPCCNGGCGPDVRGPIDPNDLIPPTAVGSRGWVRRDQVLPFRVLFENLPNASLAAQRVEIALPLMAHVDYHSFRLGDFGFSDFFYTMPSSLSTFEAVLPLSDQFGVDVQVQTHIDTLTGVIYWVFQSLDSLTGEPPMDIEAGFLVPNDSTIGNGEGFANFTITPDPESQTFDEIDFMADIIFDENEAIVTPMILLTIDADAPVSTVSSIVTSPDAEHIRFYWSGTDIGSGLDNYTLFVSENDAEYKPWLVETDSVSALLPATLGNTYRILCVARDSVRNVEQKLEHDLEVTFQRWFPDSDGDGYGQAGVPATVAGSAPAGYIADASDCDDNNPSVNPIATEICNGLDDDCDGLTDFADPGLVDDQLVRASIQVFLQGPYVAAVQLMHDSLRIQNRIPQTEPYTGLTNFMHSGGGGGEQTTPAALAIVGPDALVDWVFLELRSPVNPAQVLATRSALLQRDGDVVDVDGASPVVFGAPADQEYYLTVRHRNHLGAQLGAESPYPICEATEKDFTTLPLENFYAHNDLNPAQRIISGRYTLWAGNGRIDPQLKYNGSNNDRTAILAAVGLTTPNAIVPGYLLADYNLDGVVKYNGTANDRLILLGNVGITTPSAVIEDQIAR